MTKVAIKNENITSYGGIYHIMDVFSKLGFEKLTESVLGKRGSSGKAFCYGSIYNERGASEKNFDIQNNDFEWSHLPFSFMAENMVFMMVTAMLKNFYLYQHDGYCHVEELLSLSRPSYQREGQAIEKDKQAESLYPPFCQRASKMGENGKAERSKPVYK